MLTGTPATGDSFTINDNANGTGDNRNALKLAAVLNRRCCATARNRWPRCVAAYVGTVGLQTSQAQNGATAQQTVLSNAQTAQQSVSGVNLDQEAANMVRTSRPTQAAAQVIKMADTLFKSLMNATLARKLHHAHVNFHAQ